MFQLTNMLPALVSSFSWLALVLVILIVSQYAVMRFCGQSWRSTKKTAPSDLKVGQRPILSAAEEQFFRVLQAAIGDRHTIFPQLPLWVLIEPRSNDAKVCKAFNNRINQKRVDFVIVDIQTLRPVIAIELDDRSHQRADRQDRDAFVEELFQKVGISLIRVRAAGSYDPLAIRGQLAPHLRDNAGNQAA